MSAFVEPLMKAMESNLGSVILWEAEGKPDQPNTKPKI